MAKRAFFATLNLAAIFAAVSAGATTVQQSGNVTPGHPASWTTTGVIQDGGSATNGFLTNVGIFANGGLPFCETASTVARASFNPASSPYTQFCIHTTMGGASGLSLTSYNGAANSTFSIVLNGVTYAFPGAGTGDVIGPGSSTNGNFASFSGTTGKVIADSGISGASFLRSANNLSDVGNAATSLANLGGLSAATASATYAPLAGAVFTGAVVAPSVTTSGNPSVSTSPTGNPTGGALLATESVIVAQGTTASTTNREFQANFGLTSNKGASVANNNGDKVALYAGAVGNSGTGDLWAVNSVTTMSVGSAPSYHYNAQGYELDFNNLLEDRGNTAGVGGLAAPVAYGLQIGGAGNHLSTSGIIVDGDNIWNRGITVAGIIAQASIQDITIAPIGHNFLGLYTYGIDFQGSTSSVSPIRIPNNSQIVARNVGNSADYGVIGSFSGNVILGDPGHLQSGIVAYANTIPDTDAVLDLGISVNRWKDGWFTNLDVSGGAGPTPVAAGHGVFNATTGVGASIGGNGSVNDVSISNKLGNIIIGIPTGTANVNFAGVVAATSYVASGVVGVSCSGAPTGAFAVTNGIVTHC